MHTTDPAEVVRRCEERGFIGLKEGPNMRLVAQNDVDSDDIDYALEVMEDVLLEFAADHPDARSEAG